MSNDMNEELTYDKKLYLACLVKLRAEGINKCSLQLLDKKIEIEKKHIKILEENFKD